MEKNKARKVDKQERRNQGRPHWEGDISTKPERAQRLKHEDIQRKKHSSQRKEQVQRPWGRNMPVCLEEQ